MLRDGSYHGLCIESWMTEVADELSTRCPIVAEILSGLLDCSIMHPERKLAPLCYNVYKVQTFKQSSTDQYHSYDRGKSNNKGIKKVLNNALASPAKVLLFIDCYCLCHKIIIVYQMPDKFQWTSHLSFFEDFLTLHYAGNASHCPIQYGTLMWALL